MGSEGGGWTAGCGYKTSEGVSYSVVYKATSAANEQYLQTLYKQMQAANMACEYDPDDEEWLTYVEEDEYARFPEY